MSLKVGVKKPKKRNRSGLDPIVFLLPFAYSQRQAFLFYHIILLNMRQVMCQKILPLRGLLKPPIGDGHHVTYAPRWNLV